MRQVFISPFLIVFLSLTFFSQSIDDETNWYKEIGRGDDYYSRFDFTRYTKNDVVSAKRRYLAITSNPSTNDWHGAYGRGVAVGSIEIHWSTLGYVSFYVYHTLAWLDHGSVTEDAGTVRMLSELDASMKKRRVMVDNPLVKVRYGERRFLVPERRLQNFLDRAVGRNTSISDFGYYLEKMGDENKAFGLPIVPTKYGHMVRTPIETRIRRVGARKIHQNKHDDGTLNYEDVHRYVHLASGSLHGVKVGMNFFVDDLGEWIEVTAVRPNTSTGRIRRGYTNGEEDCLDTELGQGQTIPCKRPQAGMRARTKMSDMYF